MSVNSEGLLDENADLAQNIKTLIAQTQRLYCEDDLPWVIGYSGGKDSTATLQLVWMALEALPPVRREKAVHVISTDTLVENPVVSAWVTHSLRRIETASDEKRLPVKPHRLTPKLEDRFWVNLIGRGYPAPRPKFRWCTSRLKINASNKFIREVADDHGEAILVLGSRKSESEARRRVLAGYEGSTRELLSRNGDSKLDRVWVYTPIADWSNDDVWEFLVTVPNPWGYSNRDLLNMYRGATADAECPLVVDTSTPSCGDSRFGCFVCTLVDKDKSMQAMIQNDEEKRWMQPLADLRNQFLDVSEDRQHRDFRRMDGSLTLFRNSKGDAKLVHGPYKQAYRATLLEAVIAAQEEVREGAAKSGRKDLTDFELISAEELEEIRRIWLEEKHEIEDLVPRAFESATGRAYPASTADDAQLFGPEDLELLKELASSDADPDAIHYQTLREILDIEQSYQTASRRAGIYDALEAALKKGAFLNEQDALSYALSHAKSKGRDEAPSEGGGVGMQAELSLEAGEVRL
jgi:DNA sulfur modification protein DndC